MQSDSKCPTKLIPDIPSAEDAFDSHKRIAKTIGDLIRSEKGGKSIAIQGDWGTGKSTAIKLLREELKQDANYIMIEFDAWAHEGDPLRLTFLETMRPHIEKLDGINIKKWEDELAKLAQRKEVKEATTLPELKPLGKLVIFALFLVPIGTAFLNAAFRENYQWTPDWDLPVAWRFLSEFTLGILFTLAPFLIAALSLLRATKTGEDIWAIIFTKSPTRVRSETIKTPTPTSIEFERSFRELMENAFETPDRRIILVLDNLDRVDPEDALSILSTLQTFLQPANRFPRLWVIVPYDLRGLRLLWEKRETEQGEAALSFIDKSFHVRFHVSAPILSNWHKYLLDLLGRAFPDHYKNHQEQRRSEFHTSYRVYSVYLAQKGRLPTPRELILYVNQIGVLHRLWIDDIPLPQMAYYALLQRDGKSTKEIVDGLVKGDIPAREYQSLLGADVQDNLAALLFNVPVKTAKQLLLRGPINEAIAQRDASRLKELQNLHEGFWQVIENIAAEEWLGGSATSIGNAAFCLKEGGLLGRADLAEAEPLYRTLINASLGIKSWAPFDERMANDVIAIFELVREREAKGSIIRILKNITENLTAEQKDKEQPTDKQGGLLALRKVFEYLDAHNLSDYFSEGVIEPVSTRLFSAKSPLQSREIGNLIEILFEFRSAHNKGQEYIEKLATEGYALALLNSALLGPEIDFSSIAWSMFVYLRVYPDPIPFPSPENPSPGYYRLINILTIGEQESILTGVTDKLGEIIARYSELDLLFNVAFSNNKHERFIVACMNIMAEKEILQSLITVDLLIEHWALFKRMGVRVPPSTKLDEIISSFINSDLILRVTKAKFNRELARLYNSMSLQGAIEQSEFRDWIEKGLKGITEEEWQEELSGEGDLVWLIIDLTTKDIRLSLPAYSSALANQARIIASGWTAPEGSIMRRSDHSRRLMEPLDGINRNELRNRLYSIAVDSDGNADAAFFNVYGNELSELNAFTDGSDFLTELFEPLVRNRNAKGLEWAADLLRKKPFLLFREPPEPIISFETQVRNALSNNLNDDATPVLKQIADIFGPEILFVYDRDTVLPAFAVDVVDQETKAVDLTVRMADGTYKRHRKVRLDETNNEPGTYHYKKQDEQLP